MVLPQRADSYGYGSEGGGLTALLEAMAMGKAVVATDRAILRDYVDDGVEALIVPPEDPSALRGAIERVLGDDELATRLGAAARSRVERSHTTRGFAARIAPMPPVSCSRLERWAISHSSPVPADSSVPKPSPTSTRRGWTVHGVDNNMRADFFGPKGDTTWNLKRLHRVDPKTSSTTTLDIRDRQAMATLIADVKPDLIVHAAAQPSHDLAARRPFDDFDVNAVGTLNLLEGTRQADKAPAIRRSSS